VTAIGGTGRSLNFFILAGVFGMNALAQAGYDNLLNARGSNTQPSN